MIATTITRFEEIRIRRSAIMPFNWHFQEHDGNFRYELKGEDDNIPGDFYVKHKIRKMFTFI